MDIGSSDDESSHSDSDSDLPIFGVGFNESDSEHSSGDLGSDEENLNQIRLNFGVPGEMSDEDSSISSDSDVDWDCSGWTHYWNDSNDTPDNRLKCKSVVMNNVILDCIFGYLKVKQIKKCRLVCQRWNSVAEPLLRKRAVVSFSHGTVKNMTEFNSTFSNSQTNIPFTAVRLNKENSFLKKVPPPQWPKTELEELFREWQSKLKTLVLHNIKVYEVHTTESINTINLPFRIELGGTTMTVNRELDTYRLCPIIQSNLTSLTVNCESATQVVFSLDHLQSVKYIDMSYNVGLDVGNSGKKIIAKVIKLKQVRFLQNGKRIKKVCFNTYIDFSQAKTVRIDDNTSGNTLDVRNIVKLDYLTLGNVTILGGDDSKWTVEKHFFLEDASWTKPCKMKFTKVCFESSSVDISILPKEIEYLRLQEMKRISASSAVNCFENLKYLSVHDTIGSRNSFLSNFMNCISLTDLYIESPQFDRMELNTNWIPSSVQNMELNTPVTMVGDGIVELETLILSEWPLCDINVPGVINGLRPKNLVIDIELLDDKDLTKYRSVKAWTQMLTAFRKIQNCVIFLGPLYLKKSDYMFKKYVKKSILDVEDSYYFRFDGVQGIPICDSEFEKFLTLRKNKETSLDDEFIHS